MRQAQQHRHFGLDEAGCSTVEMQSRRHGIQLRCDRQIQTSPSESPAVWPPPSVHGSPQHRRRFFGDTGESGVTRCECSSGSGRMREPTRRELYQWWSTSEPGGRLFRAKYVYRPLRDSPNDNPETELSLTPGDYLLIFGDMDEDFYYRGELWTGERGLVPSNYVEAVSEGVLGLDSSMNVDSLPLLTMAQDRSIAPAPANRLLARAASERATSGGVGTSAFASTNPVAPLRSAKSVDAFTGTSIAQIPHEQQAAAAMCSFSSLARNELLTQSDASICPFPVVDVSNVQVQEIRPFDGARVPCPRDLVVERQLTKSVLISWSPPVNALCPVAQYHVCVDGEVRAVVPAGYKTKALIEDVDSRKVHRISVRAVSDAGRSPDETCTVTLGQGSLIRPQELKVVNVTPVSCEVSWYPSYSSCEHLVLLNGLKVGSCPSGVYRVQIRGLIPSTMYRCAIRVKDPKAVLEEKPVESYVDFKTLPKIGLPDPPSEVHCEPGPQDGTLLITWRPVTTQPKPPSRAAVAGYLVYADGRKVCEVDSPSGDHAVLRLQDLNDDPPLFITVKTKTREGAVSSDSNVVRVPRSTSSTITDAMQPVGTSQTAPTQITGVTATTATATATEKTSTTPSYYVFHPRLASQGADTDTTTGLAAAGGGGVSDLLTLSTQQEKPSLLEMETDYLSRHQQLQDRAAAYHAGASRPAVSARLQQAPTTLMTARQSAFSRRSYSLDEAPQDDYDPFGPAVLHPSGVGAATPAASTFHPVKHLRSAATAVTAFNGPHQRAGPSLLVGEALWTDSSPFRPSAAAALQMRTTIPRSRGINAPAFWPRQSDRPVAYGDFDAEPVDVLYDTRSKTGMTTATAAVPLLAENRAKMLAQGGALTSRHRRRLQDAAEARALSEPDLLHHDVNNRYLLQMPPVRHHVRRHHRSKTPTRLVVALYDYSPRHMSPNPNGHLDELSFRKGQLISILGDKDADGFYQGELDGRVGLVPSNLVVEVEGGVQALINSPPTSTGLVDYETLAGYPTGNGRYRDNRRAAARDQYYGGGYEEGGVWDGRNGGSDPMLSRRHPTALREQAHLLPEGPASSSFDNAYDRYPDMQDRYGTSASTARHRRNKYKQKSHSLEYDLDRRDYYDQEEYPYDQSGFRPVQHGRERVAEYDPSYRLAARSLDQFHYTRQQPVPMGGAGDPYDVGGVPPDERAMGRHGGQRTAGQTGGRQAWPLPQQPYRESGVSDQDSEAELLYYQRQQQRKPMGPPRRMSMFEQRQQQQMGGPAAYTEQERGWRPDERGPPPAQFATSRQRPAAAYDRSGVPVDENLRRGSRAYVGEEQLLAEARKQQPAGDFYDSPTDVQDQVSSGVRRRGSLRRSGRQQLEQNIREAVACGAARRMVAKFDYDPKILSPNPGAECEELTFRAGDTILVFGDVDEDGFYIGELGGRRGLVPSNYLVREQDAGLATMANSIQPTQPGGLPQQPMYDAQAAGTMSTGRTKKESLVSFAPAAAESSTPISAQASPSSMAERKVASGQSGRPGPVLTSGAKTSSSGGTGTKRQPGQLKKADSTVGQKVPQKKVSVAGAAPGRKTSAAVSGKSGTGGAGKSSGGQEDGGIGKVWRKIVE